MLFGESLNTLTNSSSHAASSQFAAAFSKCQEELARRARLGRLADWNISQDFLDACSVAQKYVDNYVVSALHRHRNGAEKGEVGAAPRERYIFLNELAKVVDDPVAIRDHLLNVLLPARDSTSTLLANAFFAMAKGQRVMRKLYEEVRDLNGLHPTFEMLKGMKYLKWVMNESEYFHAIQPNSLVRE